MRKGNSGFSLLEVIIVLALIGMMMAGLAHYKKKQLEEIARQNVADSLVQEMYGFLKFVNEDEVAIDSSSTPVTNPLYTKDKTEKAYTNGYYLRTKNYGLLDQLYSGNDFLPWWSQNDLRPYFTNKSCDGSKGDPTQGAAPRNFETDYIKCQIPSIIQNGAMKIDRVDLVGSTVDKYAVSRVDYIVLYTPELSSEPLFFESFKPAFDQAFRKYKLNYTEAMILRRPKSTGTAYDAQKWRVEYVSNNVSNGAIDFGTVSSHMADLNNAEDYDYAIRFSFETGIGKNTKSDGSIGVDKQCWNINKRMTGPCIKANNADRLAIYSGSGSTTQKPGLCWDSKSNKSLPCLSVGEGDSKGVNDDDQVMHLTTEKDNKTVTGTLMANLIVENTGAGNTGPDSTPGPEGYELVTVPSIHYWNFSNDFTTAKKDSTYVNSDVESEAGILKVKAMKCPVAPGGRIMYPRLAAAISSISADVGTDAQGDQSSSDFTDMANNRSKSGAVGKFGGVAVQVNLNSNGTSWTVSATTGVYDSTSGEGFNLINPKSLGLVFTSWCSTIKQA